MEFIIIGSIVGLIMGLTGAGGAMISIPLFTTLLNLPLKEATVLSLVAVLIGAIPHLLKRIKEVSWPLALIISLAGVVTSFLTTPIKEKTSDQLIAFMLVIIGIFSILSIWKKKNPSEKINNSKNPIAKGIFIGVIIGFTTSLSGLGGGVLLIPLLMIFYGKKYHEAMPLSLSSILFISMSSLLFQVKLIASQVTVKEILFLSLGTLLTFIILEKVVKYFDKKQILKVRKIVFTLLTLTAITKIAFNASQNTYLENIYYLAQKDEVLIIDVREEHEVKEGMIKHAKWFPLSKLKEEPNWQKDFKELTQGKTIYLYCRSGRRSGEVRDLLDQKGIKSKNIGGFVELKHLLPTVRGLP